MKLGTKIRHVRQMKNLSQENVAFELGVSQKSYSEMESGKTNISIERLERIAKVLGVSKEDIINYSTDKIFYYNNNTIENGYVENLNEMNKALFQGLKEQFQSRIVDLKKEIDFLKDLLKNKKP